VADQSGTGFATTGEDGFVKVWRPKTRLRNGRTVRGAKGGGLVNWSLAWEFEAERQVEALEADADVAVRTLPTNAKLAWSLDGSLIAASFEVPGTSSGNVELIDALTGALKASCPGWYGTGLCALGLVDRYLIILSEELYVWDIVNDKLSYAFAIEYPLNLKREHIIHMAHLAVDQAHGTFAIAVPERKMPSRMASTVIVMEPGNPRPLHAASLPHVATALTATRQARGFVVLDAAAEIRILRPRGEAGLQILQPLADMEPTLRMSDTEITGHELVDDEEVDGAVDMAKVQAMDVDDEVMRQDDRPVVRPEQLTNLFDVGPSYALPPVRDLWEGVLRLYGGKK